VLTFRWGSDQHAGDWRLDLPPVRKLVAKFSGDKRLDIIGLGFDGDPEELEQLTRSDPSIVWANGRGDHLPPRPYRDCYGNVLIDPDGKVLAKNLRGQRMVEAVKQYVE
jgi:hypothetical protein